MGGVNGGLHVNDLHEGISLHHETATDLTSSNDIVQAIKGGCNIIKKVNVLKIRDKCSDLSKLLQQQHRPFGFLPISNRQHFNGDISNVPKKILTTDDFDPVQLHKKIFASGKYNFLGEKIQLPSEINFQKLEALAVDYWDWQRPLFLKFGFPLNFPDEKRQCLINGNTNHSSAIDYADDIEHYLNIEKQHGAIVGPFSEPPFGTLTHTSPFMSRPKLDSEKSRVIIDLSWPENASINHFTTANVYLNTVFKLQYPTVDSITQQLRNMGKKALLYKIDLSRAFRQLPVDPYDYNLLCLQWSMVIFLLHLVMSLIVAIVLG